MTASNGQAARQAAAAKKSKALKRAVKNKKAVTKTPPPGTAKPELTPMAVMTMEFRTALIELLQTELPMKKVRGYVETLEQLPVANIQITKDGQPPKRG